VLAHKNFGVQSATFGGLSGIQTAGSAKVGFYRKQIAHCWVLLSLKAGYLARHAGNSLKSLNFEPTKFDAYG
jgi:hypothetical protein